WRPTVNTGLSEVIGSWKIIETWLPRMARIAFSGRASRSRPSSSTRPAATRPGARSSRMIDSEVTLLPQPDSPTRPSVSPGATSKDRSSTATTVVSSPSKQVVRPCTRRAGFGGIGMAASLRSELARQARVQHVAQAVAHQVDRQHGQAQEQAGIEDDVECQRHEVAA